MVVEGLVVVRHLNQELRLIHLDLVEQRRPARCVRQVIRQAEDRRRRSKGLPADGDQRRAQVENVGQGCPGVRARSRVGGRDVRLDALRNAENVGLRGGVGEAKGLLQIVIRLVTPCPYSISVSSWFCTSSKSCNVKGFGWFWQDGGWGGGL